MSQFNGGPKVRCIDCTRLSVNRCTVKDVKVSSKKRRVCKQYDFKGEFVNRTPADSIYVPYVDKNTKRLMKRLSKLGILPVTGERPSADADPYVGVGLNTMVQSTATAAIPVVGDLEAVPEYVAPPDELEEVTVWTPEDTSDEGT
jgi:hypothetical protein